MNLWLVMFTCGLITFLIRLSFIAMEGRFQPPLWFTRMLPFVPIAALTALIAPDLLLPHGYLQAGLDNPRFWAGLAAVAAAAYWRNMLLTIAVGFVALWLLQGLQ